MSALAVGDVVLVEDGNNPSLSFVVAGAPVQERPKMNFKGKKKPNIYDPSSVQKKRWRKGIEKALVDYGVTSFPVFKKKHTDQMQSKGLHIDALFCINRRAADYRIVKGKMVLKEEHQKYPGTKDTDNMLKFVMDAAHKVLYEDDKCVVKISAFKKFLEEDEKTKGQYTAIRITTLN